MLGAPVIGVLTHRNRRKVHFSDIIWLIDPLALQLRGVHFAPMVRDVDAPGKPNVTV